MSFISFWRRSLAFAGLAIREQLEYRVNFIMDVSLQPIIGAAMDMAIWFVIVQSFPDGKLGGFDASMYLLYALWAAFFSRQMGTWMYDFRMSNEIQSGAINTILTRPVSYYTSHLFQFLGHKTTTLAFSFATPSVVSMFFDMVIPWHRLLVAMLLGVGYMVFAFTFAFAISCLAFYFTRIHSIIVGKNIALWMFTGESFPLDLLPDYWERIATALPFASGIFLPVGYLTGRISFDVVARGFGGLVIGTAVMGGIASLLWRGGMKRYSGVGA